MNKIYRVSYEWAHIFLSAIENMRFILTHSVESFWEDHTVPLYTVQYHLGLVFSPPKRNIFSMNEMLICSISLCQRLKWLYINKIAKTIFIDNFGLSLSLCLYITYIYIYIYISLSLYIYIHINISIYLSFFLSFYQSIFIKSICLFHTFSFSLLYTEIFMRYKSTRSAFSYYHNISVLVLAEVIDREK